MQHLTVLKHVPMLDSCFAGTLGPPLTFKARRCYAPSVEKDVWQCELKQSLDLSLSFCTTNPIILDPQGGVCLGGYGTLHDSLGATIRVATSCVYAGQVTFPDGTPCASHSQAGMCQAGACQPLPLGTLLF